MAAVAEPDGVPSSVSKPRRLPDLSPEVKAAVDHARVGCRYSNKLGLCEADVFLHWTSAEEGA